MAAGWTVVMITIWDDGMFQVENPHNPQSEARKSKSKKVILRKAEQMLDKALKERENGERYL